MEVCSGPHLALNYLPGAGLCPSPWCMSLGSVELMSVDGCGQPSELIVAESSARAIALLRAA
jgi:hypothetical protein